MKTRIVTLALVGAVGVLMSVSAGSQEVIRSETVATSDAASVHRLYVDLKSAAARTCESGPRDELAARKCAKDALAKAVADAHQPALTAEWAANK
jgi:UrcA family protein